MAHMCAKNSSYMARVPCNVKNLDFKPLEMVHVPYVSLKWHISSTQVSNVAHE